jgi:pyruvate dehydrogenase (quinone)
VLIIPGDVLLHEMQRPGEIPAIRVTLPIVRPSEPELDAAARALNAADRVTILAGAGCADARPEVLALAQALRAPIVHALRGKEFLEYGNPYDVGMTRLLGFSSGYHAMEESDALLMLGTDFPYREFYPRQATVLQVDVRGDHIGRRVKVDVPLVGTIRDTATALLPRLKPRTDGAHLERMRRHYAHTRSLLDDLAVDDHNRTPLHPQFVARTVDQIAADDAVFVVDVGTPVIWAARYLRMNGKRRLIGSFNHGSMANALPQAIGIQAAQPGRQVVTFSGDGGLAMMFGELITLRQLKLPIKIVVFNNAALSFVELEMKAAGLINFGTDLDNPNFAAVASALGFSGQRVDHPDDLPAALRTAFEHDGPALVEVMTARQELSIPPTITLEQVKGFSLYATRAILSGRGDELVDLAVTNVARHLFDGRSTEVGADAVPR